MKIFLINLEKNQERLLAMDQQLRAFNLVYERVDAILGRALSSQALKQVYSRTRSALARGQGLKLGEIGCALSHLKIYKRMVDEQIDCALILEDDLMLSKDFPNVVAQVEAFVDKREKQVVLLSNYDGEVAECAQGICVAKEVTCADGYCVTLPAARMLLHANYPVITEADCWPRWLKRFGLSMFRAYPTTIVQDCQRFGTEINNTEEHRYNIKGMSRLGFLYWKFKRFVGLLLDAILFRLLGR